MTDDIWTVKRILDWIEGYLAQHGDANPKLSAQLLVSDALGCSRTQLFMDLERPLSEGERTVLRDYTRRRGAGEPIQYVTGTTAFRYLTLAVRPGVLIPRPETEVLVSEALALLPAPPKPQDDRDDMLVAVGVHMQQTGESFEEASKAYEAPKRENVLVADICTGSGCIACSIAAEHALAHVVATDLAPEAVALARENAQAVGVGDRVGVLECDLGAGVDSELMGMFDLVVSNPPYVPTAVLEQIPREVADYEPMLALDGGQDGLAIYRRLLDWAREALKPGGGFACELHETCLADAAAEAEYAGFAEVRVVDDLAGRPRVITARKRS